MVEIKTKKNRFVDIDLSFSKHPVSKDISKKTNELAIAASLKNLIQTRMYGRPFHPELSSQVQDLLFEPLTPGVIATLQRAIKYCIDNFEPRVEVLLIDVKDNTDQSALIITIIYRIIGTVENVKTQFILKRSL
jgi:phage baseplate assembly protein W